jgi:hypothetical protein
MNCAATTTAAEASFSAAFPVYFRKIPLLHFRIDRVNPGIMKSSNHDTKEHSSKFSKYIISAQS